jgi:hypothetical protein
MIFVDETKKAIDIILLKDKNPKAMSVAQCLGFYYKASLIPLILAVIVAALISTAFVGTIGALLTTVASNSHLGSLIGLFGTAVTLVIVVLVVVYFWILMPLGLLIDALIYHIFGKLLKQFKQGYNATFNAMVYASMVYILLFFLLGIPIVGAIVGLIIFIWSLVSIIVWMGRFQKISWVMSLVVLIVTWVVVVIIFLLLAGIATKLI